MKVLKSLFILFLFLVCSNSNQAQGLKKVTEKTTRAANDAVDKATGKAMDNNDSKPVTARKAEKRTADKLEASLVDGGLLPQYGEPCVSSEELQNRPGRYFTADQYPWPASRAEYFKKLTTAAEKNTAKQTLAQIEKLEQESRSNQAPTGGSWESTYSSEGYQYLDEKDWPTIGCRSGFTITSASKRKWSAMESTARC
ncbi:hypothetical protein FSB84_16855 [Pseudobacter ginsenosidimutans]|uniref:hypothetical protein n=1 Tax=Pseudobacter ginsenosidimutans TaxID=661488 RepID=UPI0011BB263C|nr:hypothetical protein [Pseudobacter ginsenosidimutans]QEC43283.1 hypothetical protein FSB84_16855 [Pseudobacter ginsenosidimutans]